MLTVWSDTFWVERSSLVKYAKRVLLPLGVTCFGKLFEKVYMFCQCSTCRYVGKQRYLHCETCRCEECVERLNRSIVRKPIAPVQLDMFNLPF